MRQRSAPVKPLVGPLYARDLFSVPIKVSLLGEEPVVFSRPRTGAATLTALFITFVVGPPLIRALGRLRVGQPIREIGPDHHGKAGTPTMGGLLILLSLLVSVLLWSNLDSRFIWTVIGVTAGYGLLGYDSAVLTHDLQYGARGAIRATKPPRTMCVAAVMEVLLTAMQIYSRQTGDHKVFDYLPRKSFESLGGSVIRYVSGT